MNKYRNSSLVLLFKLFSSLKDAISICITLLIFTDLRVKTIIFIGILLYITYLVTGALKWYSNTFYLDKDVFYYKSGIFIKKEKKIPLDSILSIDLEENFKHRICGLKLLKIDTGANNNIKDIELLLKYNLAITLRNDLLGKNVQTVTDEENIIYNLDLKSLFFFALTRSRFIYLIAVSFVLISLLYEANINNLITKTHSPLVVFFILIAFFLVIKLITVSITMNKYYNYKVKMNDNLLEISSGFLERKVSSLNTQKVFALKTTQNLLQRMDNKITVSVSAFGYQDNDNEEAVIFPYIDKDNVNDIIKNIFPKFIYKGKLYNINPKYKIRYKKYIFGYNNELLYLHGGILSKTTNTILIDAINEISYKQTYFQRKYNTYKLVLGYKGKKLGDLNKFKGVDDNYIDCIVEKVLMNK